MQSVAGGAILRVLNCADTARRLRAGRFWWCSSAVLSLAVSQILRATPELTPRKILGQKLRDRRRLGLLEQRHQHPQFDAVGMRLDFLGLRRQHFGGARIVVFVAVGILVVQRDVRIGDRRLLQILVDAAPAALVLGLELDGHPGAVIHLEPFDALLLDQLAAGFAGRNVDPFPLAVENLGVVLLGVDLNLEVVCGLRGLVREMTFTGLPVVSTPYMPAALMPMPCWPRLIRSR